MLIAAQDQFFALGPAGDAAEMVDRLRHQVSEMDSMTIDRGASESVIAGHPFIRLDFSGVGLFRTVLVAASRCHFVSFNLTTTDPGGRARLAQSLGGLSLGEPADRNRQVPACIKDYATSEHTVSRVEPTSAAPKFTSVPVRIIIGADGRVRHIHVIRASAAQRENVTAALAG